MILYCGVCNLKSKAYLKCNHCRSQLKRNLEILGKMLNQKEPCAIIAKPTGIYCLIVSMAFKPTLLEGDKSY